MVQLVNSKVSTSVGGLADKSDGGNIMIDPQFVVLQNSQILAQAFAGAGGAITIIAASAFIADPLSIVDASSTKGISGTVNIQAPLQNVGGELTALTQEFSSAAALLAQQCAARAADGKFSTFVVAAREGLADGAWWILSQSIVDGRAAWITPLWTEPTDSVLVCHRPVPEVRRQAHPTGQVWGGMSPPVIGRTCTPRPIRLQKNHFGTAGISTPVKGKS